MKIADAAVLLPLPRFAADATGSRLFADADGRLLDIGDVVHGSCDHRGPATSARRARVRAHRTRVPARRWTAPCSRANSTPSDAAL